jgi:preprotein translocase subunit SecF
MELFRNTRFDFLGRKWWFILPSLILSFAGLVSLLVHGGPKYGIDFLGGAVMEVRWEGTPPIERIRAAVSSRLSGVSVIVAHDLTGSNEVLVSAEPLATRDLTVLRQTIDQALSSVSTRYSIRSFEVIGPQIGAAQADGDERVVSHGHHCGHAIDCATSTAGASGGMLVRARWHHAA